MIQKIRDYIKKGKSKIAIEKTIELIQSHDNSESFRDDLIMLNSTLEEIEKRETRGLSNFEEISTHKNKINNRLLRILNEIERFEKKGNIKLNKDITQTDVDTTHLKTFKNLNEAKEAIREECFNARDIKIISNKGLVFFGMDNSIISIADSDKFKNLQRIKILLLSPNSRWLNRGFMALRRYETLEVFKKELSATHQIVEFGMKAFADKMKMHNSGIKYQKGEPYFRFLMTENKVFVSSYAENPSTQVRDLPVYVFQNEFGSLYGALRRHFNDVWKWNSDYGKYLNELIEPEISSGGVIVHKVEREYYAALVMRDDGSWVLPKGHKKKSDKNLEHTAIREVSEEIGISRRRLRVVKKIDSYSYDEVAEFHGSIKVVHFYLVEYLDDDLPELSTDPDHRTAKWWNLKEELPFMFYKYQKVLLSEAIEEEFNIKIDINQK